MHVAPPRAFSHNKLGILIPAEREMQNCLLAFCARKQGREAKSAVITQATAMQIVNKSRRAGAFARVRGDAEVRGVGERWLERRVSRSPLARPPANLCVMRLIRARGRNKHPAAGISHYSPLIEPPLCDLSKANFMMRIKYAPSIFGLICSIAMIVACAVCAVSFIISAR